MARTPAGHDTENGASRKHPNTDGKKTDGCDDEFEAMREPDFEKDGWCLDDGEQIHDEAPDTFFIPDLASRKILLPGDFAKLIFRISVGGDEPVSVERMWVIVRECIPGGYLGMLNNEPSAISENDEFWVGTELPFEYRHIIAVEHANDESRALANAPAPIVWTRR